MTGRRRPCPQCGEVDWERKTQRTYQCVHPIACPDCAARKKEERVALLFGGLECERCNGKGRVFCGFTITGADKLPPLKKNRRIPPQLHPSIPKSF